MSASVPASDCQPLWCQYYCGLLLFCVTVRVTKSDCQHLCVTEDAPSLLLYVTVSLIAFLILGLLSL